MPHASFYLNLPHVVDFSPPKALSHNICSAGTYNSTESIVILATHHTGNAETSFSTINILWPAHRITYPLLGLFNPYNLYHTATSLQDNIPLYFYWLAVHVHKSNVRDNWAEVQMENKFIFITDNANVSPIGSFTMLNPPLHASVFGSFFGICPFSLTVTFYIINIIKRKKSQKLNF